MDVDRPRRLGLYLGGVAEEKPRLSEREERRALRMGRELQEDGPGIPWATPIAFIQLFIPQTSRCLKHCAKF